MPVATLTRHPWLLALACCCGPPAQAMQLELFDGALGIQLRTQLNYGVSISTERADARNVWGFPPRVHVTGADADVARGHGGIGNNVAGDDGRLAYGRGIYQHMVKGNTDLRAAWGDFGAVVKLLYFYDTAVMDEDLKPIREPHGALRRIRFSKQAKREIGRDLRTTEAYAFWDGYLGDIAETGSWLDDVAITLRGGDQVVRWGQSTFAPGVNQINPLDANRLLTPGFDLQELFRPVGGLLVSAALNDWLTIESWAGYHFEPLSLPPGGSFFGLFDSFGPGIDDYNGLGHGICAPFTQHEARWDDANGHPSDLGGICVPLRSPDLAPDGGQWGLNLNFSLPFQLLGQVSLYALRYHNSFPNLRINRAGIIPNAAPCEFIDDLLIAGGDTEGMQVGNALKALGAPPGSRGDESADHNCRGFLPQDPAGYVARQDEFLDIGLSWQEGLRAYGIAWTGSLPFWGLNWSGEISLREDFPLQVHSGELLSAVGLALSNTNGAVGVPIGGLAIPEYLTAREIDDLLNGALVLPRNINCQDWRPAACHGPQAVDGQLGDDDNNDMANDGTFALNTDLSGTPAQGYWPRDVWQLVVSFSKILPNRLGQDSIVILWEGVYARAEGFDTGFLFDSPSTQLFQPANEFADAGGWGYRLLFLAENAGLFDSLWDLQTTVILFHDVEGTTVTNLNLFVEGRKQAVVEFGLKYRGFLASLRYLGFWGAEGRNLFSDRDTLQLNLRWTF